MALAQLTPKLRDVGANLETAGGVLSRHPDADLVVFPDLFLGGYTTNGVEDLALDPDGPGVGRMAMDPFGRDHGVFAAARALENGLPYLYVNQVGRGEAFTFAGGTMAVSADGEHLAEAGGAEGVVSVSLDPSARNEGRPEELRPRYLQEMRGTLPVKGPRVPKRR